MIALFTRSRTYNVSVCENEYKIDLKVKFEFFRSHC